MCSPSFPFSVSSNAVLLVWTLVSHRAFLHMCHTCVWGPGLLFSGFQDVTAVCPNLGLCVTWGKGGSWGWTPTRTSGPDRGWSRQLWRHWLGLLVATGRHRGEVRTPLKLGDRVVIHQGARWFGKQLPGKLVNVCELHLYFCVCGFPYRHILFFPKCGNRFSVLSIDGILKISKNKLKQKSDVLEKRKKVKCLYLAA